MKAKRYVIVDTGDYAKKLLLQLNDKEFFVN